MTKLSVNINKFAVIRNSRGGNMPNLTYVAINCEKYGAEGITVHPRPDERHIRYNDVRNIKPILNTEFNIEGYPSDKFILLVKEVKPCQVTLVPDPPNAITSNAGWNTIKNESFLTEIISELKKDGIRTSVFVDPDIKMINNAIKIGTDRIELYTEEYAAGYISNKEKAIKKYQEAALAAYNLGIGINAGHDLNLENLHYFASNIPNLLEVSIGHALVCDALYFGLENTIQLYLKQLKLL